MKRISIAILAILIIATMLFAFVLPVLADPPSLNKVPEQARVKDKAVVDALQSANINVEYVELYKDYGKREDGKSPYAITYKDRLSGQLITSFSQMPMADADGNRIYPGWFRSGNKYYNESAGGEYNNLFNAVVDGTTVTVIANNDQPNGIKAGDYVVFAPELLLDGKPIQPSAPLLLPVDSNNSYGLADTLTWRYGNVATRTLRVVEGSLLGSWTFDRNPGGSVQINYNQTGRIRLTLGQYSNGLDTEVVLESDFDNAEYPFIVGDTATFYPDADPTSTSVDGFLWISGEFTWAQARDNVGMYASDSSTSVSVAVLFSHSSTVDRWGDMRRGAFLFDTSAIPDNATITAATLSLHGGNWNKQDSGGWAPSVNIYSSAPASDTALVGGDYDSLGLVAFSAAAITYANWDQSDYNDFVFNAAGRAAIDVAGISKFGTRDAVYDVADAAPAPWVGAKGFIISCAASETSGTASDPKLVVVYEASMAPAGTTDAATDVAYTTAQVNSTVTNDGGELCDVRFEYYEDGGVAWGETSAWVNDTYLTGNKPYAELTGLTHNTLHHFRVNIRNSQGTTNGASADFTTENAVDEPSAFTAFPDGTSVTLSWVPGTGSSQVEVRVKQGAYPADEDDGDLVYFGPLSDCVHEDLDIGETYYYSAYGFSGVLYSVASADVMATTSGSSADVVRDAPTTPGSWFQTPDYESLSSLPLYASVNDFADSVSVPRATAWMLLGLAISVMFAAIALVATRRSMIGLIVMAASMLIFTLLLPLLPLWMIIFSILFFLGVAKMSTGDGGVQ